MNKAFVKEDDDAKLADLPDREISPDANLVTAEGLAEIDAKVARLRQELEATPGNTATLSRELRYWTSQRATAQLTPNTVSSRVAFGSRVTLEREDGRRETYRLVGIDESDPKGGRLSYLSPLAQALLGREEGDLVEVGPNRRLIVQIA